MTDAPFGWDDWLAFLQSETYGRDVDALVAAIKGGRTLDIGLSITCLASCAFSAGLDAGNPAPRVGPAAGSEE
jgi:hypothetical protein